jgi:uncharacterized protein (DUF4415 family)
MAKSPVAGISGVLGGLISSGVPSPALVEQTPATAVAPMVDSQNLRNAKSHSRGARRGRPPGRSPAMTVRREKVTLRIDACLIDDYRDWSWAQRCQLGELVERALSSYRRSR